MGGSDLPGSVCCNGVGEVSLAFQLQWEGEAPVEAISLHQRLGSGGREATVTEGQGDF